MRKNLELFFGLFKKPTQAYSRIKAEKPTILAIIIFFIATFLNFLTMKLLLNNNPEVREMLGQQIKTFENPLVSLILTTLSVLFFTGILYFFSSRKNPNLHFIDILTANFFSFSPIIILFPLEFIFQKTGLILPFMLLTWAQLIWSLILLIIGIKIFAEIEIKDSLIVYIKSGLILLFVLLLFSLIPGKNLPIR